MANFSFENIEPFTLIIIDSRSATNLFQIRWDGSNPDFKQLDSDQKHIWSSATLYDKEAREKREKWFSDFTSKKRIRSTKDILEFHLSEEGNKKDAILMKREIHETISITSIGKTEASILFTYYDLLENKTFRRIKVLKEPQLEHS
jgi:hypothetical protein